MWKSVWAGSETSLFFNKGAGYAVSAVKCQTAGLIPGLKEVSLSFASTPLLHIYSPLLD